jgi:hypothetical protein
MIEDLDASLKAMLTGEATPGSALATADISFAAPDETWQGQGSGMQANLYLYRVMEDRELRSNQRNIVLNTDGSVDIQLFPARLECSYIITCWEKGSAVAGMDKEPSEHALLGQILYVLWRNTTMPAQYLSGSLVAAELALPVIAAESEDMAAKPDFWSALDTYVRPAITCRVTLEIDLNQDVSGPQATTISTTVQQGAGQQAAGQQVTAQLSIGIAGLIRNAAAPAQTVPNAWILLDSSNVTSISDSTGAFQFTGVSLGSHTLTVRAVGFAQAISTFNVPDSSGVYDISLTPL